MERCKWKFRNESVMLPIHDWYTHKTHRNAHKMQKGTKRAVCYLKQWNGKNQSSYLIYSIESSKLGFSELDVDLQCFKRRLMDTGHETIRHYCLNHTAISRPFQRVLINWNATDKTFLCICLFILSRHITE